MTNLTPGMRVRCHKNLQRGDWSITVKGIVIANVPSIILSDVTFHYWEGGYERIMASHAAGKPRRRVCAWAIGTIAPTLPQGERIAITYNPYRSNRFTTRTGTPIDHCAAVDFTQDAGAFAVEPRSL